jgi:hypothetical protein
VIQTSGGVEAELANKSILVNLVATPSMTVTLAPTTLTIGGAAATATVVIQNPANSLQSVLLQGYIVQGVAPNQTRHASGGTLVTCGSNAGVLPPGTCTMTVLASAVNPAGIPGTLIAGPATFELHLMQSSSSTTYEVKTVAITLVPQNAPRITGVEIPFSITLGSASSYKAFIQNDGPSVSTVKLKNFFIQGATRREAFGRTVQCGAAPVGEVPTGGPCIVVAGFAADNTLPGSGTLVPGPATLEIDLDLQTSAGTVTLQKQFIEIILVQAMATMTLTPPSTDVVINTPVELVARYGVSIENPGLPLSTVTLQAEIKQGTTARAAGGANVTCGGTPLSGVLPDGTCTETRPISSFNQNGGSGTLVPGPAILEVSLHWFNGTTTTLLDKKTVDITLVAGVSITDLTLPVTDILPGAEYSYTVTFNNPFSTTLANARIDAYVDQGSIVGSAAGGTPLTCTQTWGELAPGTCTITYTFTVQTAPAWQLGNATFRLRLKQVNAIWDEKTFPIKIVGLQ